MTYEDDAEQGFRPRLAKLSAGMVALGSLPERPS
jgi:hypothetical protein